jgi:hypothetical protein
VSDVVRLRTFPETEVRAWLKALYSPDSYDDGALGYDGVTLENGADGTSEIVVSAAKPATKPATKPAAKLVAGPVAPPATAHMYQPVVAPQPDRGQPIEYTTVERTTVERTGAAPPSPRGAGRIVLAVVLGAAAIGLAVVGLTVNTRFAASFGQTAEAAALLAAIGLVIDLLAIVLPSSAAQLWRDRHRMAGLAAWAIWLIALGMTLLAAVGFAATNIGDGVAGRTKVAAEATGLAADAARLRAERASIAELRSVATIEAELQQAQPAAAAVWRQTAGCSDVTLVVSAAACAEVQKLRHALGTAKRRDALDAQVRAAEARLATLPAITTGDPQATMAADILTWASAGHVNLTPHDIHRLRITGLTIVPALAGIIFMFAAMLLQTGKQRATRIGPTLDTVPLRATRRGQPLTAG